MRSRSIRTTTLVVPALLLALAGCGSDDSASANQAADAATGATTDAPAVDVTTVQSTAATTDPPAAPTTEEPDTTQAPAVEELDAVELLSSMNLVGTDYGADYTLAVDVADLSTPNAVAVREAAAATPECGPPTVEAPLPYSTLSSGARIDFVNPMGNTASAELIVMPVEGAAIGYLEALRRDEMFPTCLGLVIQKTLTGAPPGITIDFENFRFLDPVPGYGDDQVTPGSDLVISQDGTVLLTVVGGTRYTRIGNVILVVGGANPSADAFAPIFYERALAAIEAS